MQVLHAGNMVNLGYVMVNNLRKLGINAELLTEKNPHKMSDPTNIDSSLHNNYPDWIKFFDKDNANWKINVLKTMRDKKYDLIHSYVEFPIFSYISRRPFLAYAQGSDLRELAFSKSLKGNLLRRAYKKAKLLITAQPDHVPLISKLKITKWLFLPIPWEFSVTTSITTNQISDYFTIFHPSNLDWRLKGNDILIKGFSEFVKNNPKSKLIIVDRGPDLQKTHELVNTLGISNNIKFIKPLNHSQLLERYNECDVVADQFKIGSMGSIALESMFCQKPVMTYLNEELHKQLYKEPPPVLNVSNSKQINENLELLKDKKILNDMGIKSKDWVSFFHSPLRISETLKIIYEEILNDSTLEEIKLKINNLNIT